MAAPKNPAGAKSDKIWRDAVMRAVRRRDSDEDPQALEKLADVLVATAMAGDVVALKEIGDRLDGKPAIAVTGEGGGPIKLEIGWLTAEPSGS